MKRSERDWALVRAHYESSHESLREVAVRFGIPERTVFRRSSKEGWHQNGGSLAATNGSAVDENGSGPPPTLPADGSGNGSSSSKSGSSEGSDPAESGSDSLPPVNGNGSSDGREPTENGSTGGSMRALEESGAPPEDLRFVIPDGINEMSLVEAAHFYHGRLGWAVHPLLPHDKGDPKQRGKKPTHSGWRDHCAADVTSEDIDLVFGKGRRHNLGVVVRPPFVAVDLDSKPDGGASVMAWLESRPELATVPRERTGGGAHLHFRCPDLPDDLRKVRKPVTVSLNEAVTAELYLNGLNLVVSPSIHKSGHVYAWEVTGPIPEVKWGVLASWFGFALPEQKKRGGRWDLAKWWLRYDGDLRTLDLPTLCSELGWRGDCLDPDSGKWAVRCPWSSLHSDDNPKASGAPGSDTVLFEAVSGHKFPGFKCLHAHCSERTLEHFLEEAEKAVPGIVNRRCATRRERGPVKMETTQLPFWLVPDGSTRTATESIRELGNLIAPRHSMFIMNAEVVRLLNARRQPYCSKRRDDEVRDDFAVRLLTPVQLITAVESSCRPCFLRKTPDGEVEVCGTVLRRAQAEFTLESAEFADALPELRRVLRSPVPSPGDRPGELLFPEPGYNPETGIFLSLDSVRAQPLPPTEANIAWAKAALAHLLAYGNGDSFAYGSPQDECHSFARFLTPFCRGLMGWNKGPVWTFEADDPGTGKDTLADLTHVQQTGAEIGYAPTSDAEEMRKAISSFLLAGGSFFHLGNVRGVFRCAPFEQASSATLIFQDRLLGQNKTLHLRNEAEYSFSANDAVFSPDILRRCRRIFQRWKGESVNHRVFRIRGIIGWTFRNRSLLATAVLTLIQAWWRERHGSDHRDTGSPLCEFSSFPRWAEIVGNLCLWAGFGNPTRDHLLDTLRRDIGAPDASEDRLFLRLLHEHTGGDWIPHGEVLIFAEQQAREVLQSVNWDRETTWRRQVGRKLVKLVDKECGPHLLLRRGGHHHQSRAEYRVTLRPGQGPDEDAPPPSAFTGDWFRAPAVPCLDAAGNLALPDRALQVSPCALPAASAVPAAISPPIPPVMPVFSEEPVPPSYPALNQKNEVAAEKMDRFRAGYDNGGCPAPETGITGSPGDRSAGVEKKGASAARRESVLCTSKTDLDRVVDDLVLSGTGRIALDLETYGNRKGDGLDPWRGEIRLLTLCREDGPVWMLDIRTIGYDLGPLAALLRTATLAIHNAKFDLLWLRVKFGLDCRRVCCTLTAARLLTAGTRAGNTLDDCLKRHLSIESGPDHSRSDWGSPLLLPEQFAYASRDVAHLHELAGALEGELEREGLGPVWQLEMALLPCVVDMEDRGIAVDREKLQAIAARQRAVASESAEILRTQLGAPDLNLSSPNQLLSALRSAGLDLKTTREDELKQADEGRFIPLILQYRAAEKRAQQAEALIEPVKSDGRIHARFEPTGTMTGRFSSKEPNLQNIGRGELREAFVPAPGHRFIVADYSQVELRAAAAIAGETKMIEAYREGADLHTRTASTVLGADPVSISKEQRQTAKAVAFGLLYGQSAPGLVRYAASSYGVTMEIEEARRIRAAFFRTYGHLRQWHGESHQRAERGIREVRTRLGRRRLVPEGASDWDRFTALVNTPVQGGCADGMKRAIVLLSERLPAGARILSTVHDELIVEAPEAEAETVLRLVLDTMREAMAGIFPEVPIEVEGGVCEHWGEK